jgi:phosphoribosylaminoimidazolecarboxamide formyltransferase/IMP cyclohydrolase
MIRAGAKNFSSVTTIVNPNDYQKLVEIAENGSTPLDFRKEMALTAFAHTADYDALIAKTLELECTGETRRVVVDTKQERLLRYGENPHQKAWVYSDGSAGLAGATPLQGKALSYNNMLDADAAYRSCLDLNQAVPNQHSVTVIKHLNPCGAAVANTQLKALELAWSGDPVSAFGSIICFNQTVEKDTAWFFKGKFIEVIIAPDFTEDALWFFSKKKNVRLLKLNMQTPPEGNVLRSIDGGFLIQEEDAGLDSEFKLVSSSASNAPASLLKFGSMVTKHLKSNAISLVKETDGGFHLLGAGMGNPNRLVSTEQAIAKAAANGHTDLSDAILVSDAFFPFRDNIDLAQKSGVKAIIQPGGSIRDPEVIEACDEHGISMYFTGRRHFRH